MKKFFQNGSLKPWHKVLLRFTLPFIGAFLVICTMFTLFFLGIPCLIAAFISWVLFGNMYLEYTTVWTVFPLCILHIYIDWLKDKDII